VTLGRTRRGWFTGAVTAAPCRPSTRLRLLLVAPVAAVAALSGCVGDPEPDPSTAPLEVVLDGCQLNRESVAAGGHTLAVVGRGRATVTDPGGAVVLTAHGGEETPAGIELASGTYAVTCEPEGGRVGEAELRVTTG
jgi:hypothetical protein